MKLFLIAVVLVFAASVQSCDFPHAGDGGVFDEEGNYIPDSVLVWVDVANNCFAFTTDQEGEDALNSWIEASNKFNTDLQNGDTDGAFDALHQANDSFADVAPYINDPDLSEYFATVHEEFGALVDSKVLDDINQYMIDALPIFKEKLGCEDNILK